MAELRFRGKYDHAIDEKGRLSFPSRFREVLRCYQSEILLAIPWENHLRAYPLAEWEILENSLKNDRDGDADAIDRMLRYFESESYEILADKQGRILLPPPLRSEVGLKKDIVLIGMIERVEIWDRETWGIERELNRTHFAEMKHDMKKRGFFS
jgi:MraZ protein